MLPVNFAVLDGTILIRTAEGTFNDGHSDDHAALEVDHTDHALRQGWSVLVRGQAHRVTRPAELRRLYQHAPLWSWPGGDRQVYVRIHPSQITGRRIENLVTPATDGHQRGCPVGWWPRGGERLGDGAW